MEWLGGTISKEDVGEEGGKGNRRRRDGDEDEALGAFALRFKYVGNYEFSHRHWHSRLAIDTSNSSLLLKH